MKAKFLLVSLFLLSSITVFIGQNSYTLSGTIRDASNGETLIGASVYVSANQQGTISNEYGFYSLDLPSSDSLDVVFSYIGFESQTIKIKLDASQTLNVELGTGIQLEEVVVKADGVRETIRSTQMSVEKIGAKQAKLIPALLGEADIIKTIQLKPGIPSGSEGTTGLFVRGGGADQNLIILDEAVVYNASHLFGFFSTFNTDAVKDLQLYKGGFPAQYGGRMSSVIDVKLKDGNYKKFSGSGGIGIISSRLTLEGPLAKNEKASFIVSGRRTYIDLITDQINKSNENKPNATKIPGYYFYDLNAKINYKVTEKDRLYLSGYFGRDRFSFKSDQFKFGFNWGNATGTLRWNHIFNPRLFLNTTATFSDYQYNINNQFTGFSFDVGSAIQDMNLKADFYYNLSKNQNLKFGAGVTYHKFKVGRLQAGNADNSISFQAGSNYDGVELGAYISDEFKLPHDIKANVGLRLSGFSNDGTTYLRLEPRAAFNIPVNDNLGIKASYARMNQYVHLVSSAGLSLPTDIWYPSTKLVKPQRSDQVALGASYAIADGYMVTAETYYKWLGRQVDFIDQANLFANNNLELEFDFGKGRAYGFEFQLEKKSGKLTGWIGYTLSKTERYGFPRIMDGRTFRPRYDRRHDISVVAIYELSKRWSLTASWVYGSGDLTWLPTGRMVVQEAPGSRSQTFVPVYGDRNNYRLPAYHRGDVGVVCRFFPSWGENDLTLSIFNVYNRRNAFFLYIDTEYGDSVNGVSIPTGLTAKQVSLFPILPSLTWNFKF